MSRPAAPLAVLAAAAAALPAAFAAPVAVAVVLAAGQATLALLLVLELRRRAEIVARAAHELRGPMMAAVLALHAARRAGLGPIARRAALDAVAEQLDRATLAAGDLEPAAAGRVPGLRRTPVDLRMLLDAQVAAWQPLATARGRDLRVVAGAPRTTLTADRRLLRQALANIIANALDHGTGDVLLAARRRGEHLRIEVLDRAPATAALATTRHDRRRGRRLHALATTRHNRHRGRRLHALASLFDAVRRGGRHRHGHGLRVAADVAARHGGRLLLARDGRGTVAILELPLPGATPLRAARRRRRAGARPTGVRGERIPA